VNSTLSSEARSALVKDVKAILATTDTPLGNAWGEHDPEVHNPHNHGFSCALNGPVGDGHESFVLSEDRSDFEFCKTAAKPYDVVVTAILICAQCRAPEVFSYSSDGTKQEWQPGLELARRATGNDDLQVEFDTDAEDEVPGGREAAVARARQVLSDADCEILGII